MKRSLTGIIAATMVLGTAVPAAFADAANTTPNDISGNQYATAIQTLVNMGTPGDASNPEALNLYSDGSFRPDLGVSRGQFIAYVYNVLKEQQVITKDYNQDTQPYIDEDSYFRNQINDMYLYGFLNNLDLGNGAIGENYKTPAWWASQLLCNVAGISYDSSQPYDALNQARKAGWFANTPDEKTNPNYYLNRGEMAQVLLNFYVQQYPDAFNGVVASATVSAKDATTSVGVKDALSVTATDLKGNAIDLTQGSHTVTYSVQGSNASDAAITSAGNFVATAGGKYSVVATVDGVQTAPVTINVYGQPAGLTVKAAGSLVADGAVNKQTVAVQVVDSNGNAVQNYNGPVTLSSGTTSDATVEAATVNAVYGVATFKVDAATTAKAGDSVTLTATIPNPSLTATGTIGVAAAQATTFSINYATGAKQGIEVNDALGGTTLTVQAQDQASDNITNMNQYVTATVSGPATFPGGVTTQQVWVGGGVGTIVLQGKQGQSGNVVVTVSATGLQNGTFTVPAFIQTPTATISGSVSGSVNEGGTGTLTVKTLDSNGNVALGENGLVTVTGLPSGTSLSGTGVAGNTIQVHQGIASATVNNSSYVGSASVTLSYTVNGVPVTTVVPVTFVQGAATQLVPTSVANNVYLPAGTTQTFSFQLEDGAGSAMKTSGLTFSVVSSLGNSALSATSVTSDANGVVSVNVTLPNYDSSWGSTPKANTLTLTQTNNASGTAPISYNSNFGVSGSWYLSQAVAANVYDTIASGNSSTPVTSFSALTNGTASMTAGDVVYLDVYGFNAAALPVTGDSYSVTSSNPNVVSVTAKSAGGTVIGSNATPAANGTNANVALAAGIAGTSVITVTDNSVPSKPTVSFNVSVQATGKVQKVTLAGLSTSSTTPTVVVPGQSYPITVQLTDNGGNAAFNPGTSYTVSLNDGTGLSDFRNAVGATITSVTIDGGVGSTVVYWVAPAHQITSTTTLATGSTITLSATDSAQGLAQAQVTPLSLQ